MEARITLSKDTAQQKSTVGMLLEYIQKHPEQTKHTNFTDLAHAIKLSGEMSRTEFTISTTLSRMRLQNLIYWTGRGRKKGKIGINYLHHDIPGYILENAPDDVREKALEVRRLVDEEAKPAPQEPVPTSQELAPETQPAQEPPVVQVEKQPDGSIKLSLTLNININNGGN